MYYIFLFIFYKNIYIYIIILEIYLLLNENHMARVVNDWSEAINWHSKVGQE